VVGTYYFTTYRVQMRRLPRRGPGDNLQCSRSDRKRRGLGDSLQSELKSGISSSLLAPRSFHPDFHFRSARRIRICVLQVLVYRIRFYPKQKKLCNCVKNLPFSLCRERDTETQRDTETERDGEGPHKCDG
jgi:hypothetical protein